MADFAEFLEAIRNNDAEAMELALQKAISTAATLEEAEEIEMALLTGNNDAAFMTAVRSGHVAMVDNFIQMLARALDNDEGALREHMQIVLRGTSHSAAFTATEENDDFPMFQKLVRTTLEYPSDTPNEGLASHIFDSAIFESAIENDHADFFRKALEEVFEAIEDLGLEDVGITSYIFLYACHLCDDAKIVQTILDFYEGSDRQYDILRQQDDFLFRETARRNVLDIFDAGSRYVPDNEERALIFAARDFEAVKWMAHHGNVDYFIMMLDVLPPDQSEFIADFVLNNPADLQIEEEDLDEEWEFDLPQTVPVHKDVLEFLQEHKKFSEAMGTTLGTALGMHWPLRQVVAAGMNMEKSFETLKVLHPGIKTHFPAIFKAFRELDAAQKDGIIPADATESSMRIGTLRRIHAVIKEAQTAKVGKKRRRDDAEDEHEEDISDAKKIKPEGVAEIEKQILDAGAALIKQGSAFFLPGEKEGELILADVKVTVRGEEEGEIISVLTTKELAEKLANAAKRESENEARRAVPATMVATSGATTAATTTSTHSLGRR